MDIVKDVTGKSVLMFLLNWFYTKPAEEHSANFAMWLNPHIIWMYISLFYCYFLFDVESRYISVYFLSCLIFFTIYAYLIRAFEESATETLLTNMMWINTSAQCFCQSNDIISTGTCVCIILFSVRSIVLKSSMWKPSFSDSNCQYYKSFLT